MVNGVEVGRLLSHAARQLHHVADIVCGERERETEAVKTCVDSIWTELPKQGEPSVFSLTGVCVDKENGVQVAQRGQGEAQEVLVRYAEVRTLEERKRAQRFLVVSHNSVLYFRFGGLKLASKSILDLILRLASLVSIPAPGNAREMTRHVIFFFLFVSSTKRIQIEQIF